jgi:hypothetical protein
MNRPTLSLESGHLAKNQTARHEFIEYRALVVGRSELP